MSKVVQRISSFVLRFYFNLTLSLSSLPLSPGVNKIHGVRPSFRLFEEIVNLSCLRFPDAFLLIYEVHAKRDFISVINIRLISGIDEGLLHLKSTDWD